MLKDFTDGLRAYADAFRLIRELRLGGYLLLPALISVLLAGAIGAAAWFLSGSIGGLLTGWWPWEWGIGVVEKIGSVMGGLLVAALGFILYKNLVIVIAGPFMSPLSEKVEAHITGKPVSGGMTAGRFVSDIIRGIRIALRCIIREILLTILLLLLGLIPIFSPVTAVLIFLVQSYYAGFGNMDYALERHFRVRGSINFVHQHRGLALGNGLVFIALLLTGIGFLIAPPLATIAATQETVRRL